MHSTTTALITSLLASPLVSALGINCQGSSIKFLDVETLHSFTLSLDPNHQYSSGEKISCVKHTIGGTCAFFQGISGTMPGGSVPLYIQDILDYGVDTHDSGCQVHGSVPITFPQSNSPNKGILMVNFVGDTDECNVSC